MKWRHLGSRSLLFVIAVAAVTVCVLTVMERREQERRYAEYLRCFGDNFKNISVYLFLHYEQFGYYPKTLSGLRRVKGLRFPPSYLQCPFSLEPYYYISTGQEYTFGCGGHPPVRPPGYPQYTTHGIFVP
jgi:hypothetical protein